MEAQPLYELKSSDEVIVIASITNVCDYEPNDDELKAEPEIHNFRQAIANIRMSV